MVLRYRSFVEINALNVNECTIHRNSGGGKRWWTLWFHVARETDGGLEFFEVPIAPNGAFCETGPGGRTWGLTQTSAGVWQISPSIDVVSDADGQRILAGTPRSDRSVWHQTPTIEGVPDGEAWATQAP